MKANHFLYRNVVDYMCHCYLRQDGLGAVIVTDKEYPSRVAFNLETRLLDDFDAKYMFYIVSEVITRARWKNAKEDNQFPVSNLAKTLEEYQVVKSELYYLCRILPSVIRSLRSIPRLMKQKKSWYHFF